jgi:hypothetical protein
MLFNGAVEPVGVKPKLLATDHSLSIIPLSVARTEEFPVPLGD